MSLHGLSYLVSFFLLFCNRVTFNQLVLWICFVPRAIGNIVSKLLFKCYTWQRKGLFVGRVLWWIILFGGIFATGWLNYGHYCDIWDLFFESIFHLSFDRLLLALVWSYLLYFWSIPYCAVFILKFLYIVSILGVALSSLIKELPSFCDDFFGLAVTITFGATDYGATAWIHGSSGTLLTVPNL